MSGTVALLAVTDGKLASERVARLLSAEGWRVVGPTSVDPGGVRDAVASADASAVIVVGHAGLSGNTPAQLAAGFDASIPGFLPIAYGLWFAAVGSAAASLRASAGFANGRPVISLPGLVEAAVVVTERLVLPELTGWMSAATASAEAFEPGAFGGGEPASDPVPPASVDGAPKPSGSLGFLGRPGGMVEMSASPDAVKPETESDEQAPGAGWKRAVFELGGEIIREKREELPQPVERFGPLVDVLHSAGEQAVLKLPDGVKYSLWGYPDLRRPGSKVLAVGWGQPLCEVLALHRYPVQTGLCIDDAHGQLPKRGDSVADICETVTGAAPPDDSGGIYAIDGERVWLERDGQVVSWDGRRERREGSPKQMLGSLVLQWSNR